VARSSSIISREIVVGEDSVVVADIMSSFDHWAQVVVLGGYSTINLAA
jgi:hypothetical protein